MLAIRLSRVGKKKYPTYRVVVSEKSKDTVGNYLELLGHYNPHTNKAELKAERIQYWISKGAQPSGTVHNLLVHHNVIEGEKIKVANIKKKKEEDKPAEPAEKPKETPKPEEKPTEEEKKEDAPAEDKPAEEEKSAKGGSASGGK